MQIQPYLFFDGRCEEAIEFYKQALGAEVVRLLRFKDSPEPPQPGMVPPGAENKVMHASFRIGETLVMASDGRCQGKPTGAGFGLSKPKARLSRFTFKAVPPQGIEAHCVRLTNDGS